MRRRRSGFLTSVRLWVFVFFVLLAGVLACYTVADRITPFTTDAYVQAYVVEVAPQVEGQVVEVNVANGSRVKKGDTLFRIDPRLFQYEADRRAAALVQAQARIGQLQARLDALRSVVGERETDVAYAKAQLGRILDPATNNFAAKQQLDLATDRFRSVSTLLDETRSEIISLEHQLAAMAGDEHAEIRQAKAELEAANLRLAETDVTAPIDGVVDDLQLSAGTYATTGQAVMTLVDDRQWWIVANYQENALSVIRPGQKVIMSLFMYPGRTLGGKVVDLGRGVSVGQGNVDGQLPEIDNPDQWIARSQRFQVRIAFDEVPDDMPLRVGATVRTVVLTQEDSVMNRLAEYWLRAATYLDFVH